MITLLFDIDGTLVHTGGAGGAALRSAFRDVFNVARPRDVEFSGRTDLAIGREMIQANDVAHAEDNWPRLKSEYLSQLPAFLPRCKGRVLPGVPELLERLAQVEDVAIGLLTGNLRDGARLKLEHYQLMHHFSFGGFGDEHHDRNQVAEMAVAESQRKLDGQFDPKKVWVVGDTPLDIRCARWVNARILAVATGAHSRDELAGHQPDVLADDLADTERVMAWLCG